MANRFIDLTELADRFRTDKGSVDGDRHLYTEIYAAAFESFRLEAFNLLELGLLRAPNRLEEADPASRPVDRIPSIEMWLEYFPRATCYGFDLADFSAYQKPRFSFTRGDLSKDADIRHLAEKIPKMRIIIDDASHASYHQQRVFLQLFPLVEPGGFYIIEDLHYSPPFEEELPACRKISMIFEEFFETGVLNLDFCSTSESAHLAAEINHTFMHCSARGRPNWGPKLVMLQKRNRVAETVVNSISASVQSPTSWLTTDWLSSRAFRFIVGEERMELAKSLKFERNGRISGYRHSNETAWLLEDGNLVILRDDGARSCIASPHWNDDGTVSFIGQFLFDDLGSIHRFDEVLQTDGFPSVSTFDLFDTLVARRCYEPLAIFSLVETKSRVPDFARLRRDAEVSIWHANDYDFDDIYVALGNITGWSQNILNRLKMLELAEEWDHLFPIQEIVSRVGPDDMIITDMYLPMNFIRRIVDEKCKLVGRTIHLSAHGKSRGGVWPKIQSSYRILCHYGDNWGSDVISASNVGINSEHVTVSGWNWSERILVDAGLLDFAKVIRETRLTNFHSDPQLHSAVLAQLEVNIPSLLLSSLDLLRHARECDADTLLMCSRDCNLWFHLMQWMAPLSEHVPLVKYLISSRVLFLSDSPEYCSYFSSLAGHRNILIDVAGTGRSPSHFIGHIGDQENSSIYLLTAKHDIFNFVSHMARVYDDVEMNIFCEQEFEVRFALECMNVSLEGRAHRMSI